MNRSLTKAYPPELPKALARIFGAPPLVGDEDPLVYRQFFSLMAAERDPRDIGDWLIVKHRVDIEWERLRERRLKPEVIKIYQKQPDEDGWQQPIFIISPEDAKL
jgi:hypothetical protein